MSSQYRVLGLAHSTLHEHCTVTLRLVAFMHCLDWISSVLLCNSMNSKPSHESMRWSLLSLSTTGTELTRRNVSRLRHSNPTALTEEDTEGKRTSYRGSSISWADQSRKTEVRRTEGNTSSWGCRKTGQWSWQAQLLFFDEEEKKRKKGPKSLQSFIALVGSRVGFTLSRLVPRSVRPSLRFRSHFSSSRATNDNSCTGRIQMNRGVKRNN